MARQCMRPGCARPVAASLTYDPGTAAVWLDEPLTGGEMAQQVCAEHAAALTAPLGWTVTDRRLVAVRSQAPSPEAPAPEAPAPEAAADEAPADDAPVDEAPADEAPADDAPAPDAPLQTGAEPAASDPQEAPPEAAATEGAEDDAGRSRPRPRGPLLDRAFEWTGPQHSVLTTGPPSADSTTDDG